MYYLLYTVYLLYSNRNRINWLKSYYYYYYYFHSELVSYCASLGLLLYPLVFWRFYRRFVSNKVQNLLLEVPPSVFLGPYSHCPVYHAKIDVGEETYLFIWCVQTQSKNSAAAVCFLTIPTIGLGLEQLRRDSACLTIGSAPLY